LVTTLLSIKKFFNFDLKTTTELVLVMEGLSDKFMIDFFLGKVGTQEEFLREVIRKMCAPYPGITYEEIIQILPDDVMRDLENTVDGLSESLKGANNLIRFEPNKETFESISSEFISYEERRVYRCLGLAYNIVTEEESEALFNCLLDDD